MPIEKEFWKAVRAMKLALKWRRQQPFDSSILDFYCAQLKIAIEFDSDSHLMKADYDANRDTFLRNAGVLVLRFGNSAIKENRSGVMEAIDAAFEIQSKKLNG